MGLFQSIKDVNKKLGYSWHVYHRSQSPLLKTSVSILLYKIWNLRLSITK